MTGDATDRFLRLLVEHSREPAVLEETVRAARRRSDLVAALPEQETRRHVRALINGVLAALENGGEPGPDVLDAAGRLGSDRARQGVPVAAFLDGFQAGRAHLVATVVAEGRRLGVPADLLLEGVTRIDAITTALVHRMVHAHRVAELEAARTARESRQQALRQLLHGEPAAVPAPLDPAAAYHCVASEISDPALAARLEDAFAASGPAVCGLVDGRFAALTARPPAAAALPPGVPLLVAAPPVPLDGVASRYALCRRALRAGGAAGLDGLRALTDLALLTVTEADPELGGLLAGGLLAGLRPGDPFHREIAATALAYLDHGARVEAAAEALHVHPNTVKYRLRRLRELTGRSPADPGCAPAVPHAAHWWWALRRWLAGPPRDTTT
ncbi:helix-turn-helix domain-containing protein [Actinomadura atramentaria]|uniref:helix-turn-helix domain-containing protein n=1 Tax=Actinomadura atramentaria TaxID=1990 RepID=UPI00037E40BC|nr:helix-turn-helix domain-containing protein [Actinomadura atramentaria]